LFLKEPSLLELHTAAAQVAVVGDLHGQFEDLQRIFERLGAPGSDGKVWVFLGDYVDRGGLPLARVLRWTASTAP
jgi:serine/threonine-protein phosphatase PP1 catalytic subunit